MRRTGRGWPPRQVSPRARSQRQDRVWAAPGGSHEGQQTRDHGPDCPSAPGTFQVWVKAPPSSKSPRPRFCVPQRPLPPHSGTSPKRPSPLPPAHCPGAAPDTCWTDRCVGVSSCLRTKAFLPSRAGRTFLKLQRLRHLPRSRTQQTARPGEIQGHRAPAVFPAPATRGLSRLLMAKQPGTSPRVWARSSEAEAHSPHRPCCLPRLLPQRPPDLHAATLGVPSGERGTALWAGQVRTTCRLLHPEPWASPPIKCTETNTHRVTVRPGQGVRCQRMAGMKPWRTQGQHQPHPPQEDRKHQTLWKKTALGSGGPSGVPQTPP